MQNSSVISNSVKSRPGLTIFVVALIIRIAFLLAIGDRVKASPDKVDRYDKVALSIQAGEGFSIKGKPTAQAGPLYPGMLAILYFTFGYSLKVVRIFLSVLDALQCILFYKLAIRYFGSRVGFLTAILLILSPFSMYSILVASTEVPFTLLHAALLLVLAGAFEVTRYRQFWISGIILGFAALCRATALLLPIFLAPAFLLSQRKDTKTKFLSYCAFLIAIILVVSPWIIRNYARFHVFIPIQTMGGIHLYFASPGNMSADDLLKTAPKMTPVERDSYFFREGMKNIRKRPFRFIQLMMKRLPEMWYRTDSMKFDHILMIMNGALLSLALAGVILLRKRWRELLPLYLTIIYYVVIHLFLVALVRYMVVVIPLIFILAAVPLEMLWTRMIRKTSLAGASLTREDKVIS